MVLAFDSTASRSGTRRLGSARRGISVGERLFTTKGKLIWGFVLVALSAVGLSLMLELRTVPPQPQPFSPEDGGEGSSVFNASDR
jgi:hypothetical protein